MADLDEVDEWVPVRRLEKTDPVEGGPDGASNRAPSDLTKRTFYLRKRVDELLAIATPRVFGPGDLATSTSIDLTGVDALRLSRVWVVPSTLCPDAGLDMFLPTPASGAVVLTIVNQRYQPITLRIAPSMVWIGDIGNRAAWQILLVAGETPKQIGASTSL